MHLIPLLTRVFSFCQGPSALFRQPNASNLLENAAKPVDLPPSQTPSRASGSQLQNKSADPDALNVKARHAALGAITFAGSTEGVKSTPLAAFATGVQGSAQSADLGTLDAARATGVPGQAGGDILKGAPVRTMRSFLGLSSF